MFTNKMSSDLYNNQESMCSSRDMSISTLDICNKLSDLERRASVIEEQFKILSERASAIDELTQSCIFQAKRDTRKIRWMQLLMDHSDCRSKELYNYANLFLHLVLDRMKESGIIVSSLSDMWTQLKENKECEKRFISVLNDFDISNDEIREVKAILNLILAVGKEKGDVISKLFPKTPSNTPREDTNLEQLFLNMNINDNMKKPMEKIVKHALKSGSETTT